MFSIMLTDYLIVYWNSLSFSDNLAGISGTNVQKVYTQ